MSHGRFENVAVYAPAGTPTSFVLLLSGDEGWNPAAASLARMLARHGAMVAGIDLKKLTVNLEADDSDCVFPDGDLENLSHFVQAFYRLPAYLTPFLVGYRGGAGLSYATLVQAPPNTFAGALTLGFCPTSNLHKPLCKGSGPESFSRSGERGTEFFRPSSSQIRGSICKASATLSATHARSATSSARCGARRWSCCRGSDLSTQR